MQDKIVTENSSLMKLLKENTEDSLIAFSNRLYVDSPGINDDEDSFKFVDTDIKELDQNQENNTARQINKNVGFFLCSPDHNSFSSPKKSIISERKSTPKLPYSSNSEILEHSPPVVSPAYSPLTYETSNKLKEQDSLLLEKEELYQVKLQEKINKDQEFVENFAVPPLDLEEDSEPDINDSLEFGLYEHQKNKINKQGPGLLVGDHAGNDFGRISKDSLDFQFKEIPRHVFVSQQNSPIQSQQMFQHNTQNQQQTSSQNLQNNMQQSHPGVSNQDLTGLPYNQQMIIQQQQQQLILQQQQIQQQLDIIMDKSSQQKATFQAHKSLQKMSPRLNKIEQKAHKELLSDKNHLQDQKKQSLIQDPNTKGLIDNHQIQNLDDVDYIVLNKEALQKKPPQTKYSTLHKKRKEKKESFHHRRKPLTNRKTEINTEDKHSTPEEMWEKRLDSLSNKSGNNKKSTLKKMPSENEISSLLPQNKVSFKVNPESVRPSDLPQQIQNSQFEPQSVSSQPLTHTLYTEDGKSLNIDINLKVTSPPSVSIPSNVNPRKNEEHISKRSISPDELFAKSDRINQSSNLSDNLQQFHPLKNEVYQTPRQFFSQYKSEETSPEIELINNEKLPALQPRRSSVGSPYSVLPPIKSEEINDKSLVDVFTRLSPRQNDSSANLGYMAHFKKHKNKKFDYKEYTIDDYRKLKKEFPVKLGGLGPDLNNQTLKEKRQFLERQRAYAKKVEIKNNFEEVIKKSPSQTNNANDELDILNRRKVALEYAKNIPRPKIKSPSRVRDDTMVHSAPSKMGSILSANENSLNQHDKPADLYTPDVASKDLIDLETLRERHEKDRQKAEVIRQNFNATRAY